MDRTGKTKIEMVSLGEEWPVHSLLYKLSHSKDQQQQESKETQKNRYYHNEVTHDITGIKCACLPCADTGSSHISSIKLGKKKRLLKLQNLKLGFAEVI